ncbi:MAG: sodium:alanine symporter family protein [Oscillospiraceae bacterium]|nr:sodium:alanine symporter family protein [Oscillospiraceae bacterium]
MEAINNFLVSGTGFLFGPIMLVVFFGTGILMTIVTKGVQFRKFGAAFREVFGGLKRKTGGGDGTLKPFQALATALSSCVGNGNIVGVAAALVTGGPGAIFWMWIASITGMATKYSEIVLAMHYREKDKKGIWRGGVMYILQKGMGENWKWLAKFLGIVFAVCCVLVSLISCNAVQANSMVSVLGTTLPSVPNYVWGILFCILSGLVIMGGIKKIGGVCTVLTPVMAIIYVFFGLLILLLNIGKIPAAFGAIFASAFSNHAVWGGITGITIRTAISKGVTRGVFSNEAGVGGAPLVHVTSDIDVPAKQGLYGIVEVFVDTIVICTFTALIIMVSGVGDMLSSGALGIADKAAISNQAWINTLGGFGDIVVTVCLLMFCFSTIIGWCTYGETAFEWLFGDKALPIFRILHLCFTFIGCMLTSDLLWNAADFCNGVMCIPNLFSLILFCGIIYKDTKQYIDPIKKLKRARV